MERFECSVDSAGEVALQAASNFFGRAPLSLLFVDVGTCLGVVGHARDGRHVQSTIESSVFSAVESVASGVP